MITVPDDLKYCPRCVEMNSDARVQLLAEIMNISEETHHEGMRLVHTDNKHDLFPHLN